MNLNNFYYFNVIVEEGSLSRAARRLYISQPSLSHFVTNLERELGVSLLVRSKNHPLALTPAGEAYYRASKGIMSAWNGLEKELTDFRENAKQVIHVGLSTSKCPALLGMILPAFRERHPDVQIHMESDSVSKLEEGVVSHKYDIAFSAYNVQREELQYYPIHQEEVDLVVPLSHPMYSEFCSLYQENGYISLPWVGNSPFVLVEKGRIIHDVCAAYYEKIGFTPRCDVYTEASVTCADILRSGDYLGLIPRSSVTLDRKLLVTFPLNPPMIHTTGFYFLKGKPSSILKDMVSLLHAQLKESAVILSGEDG